MFMEKLSIFHGLNPYFNGIYFLIVQREKESVTIK